MDIDIIAILAGLGGLVTSIGVLLKARMEARKVKSEASSIDVDADIRRDEAAARAMESLARNYEERLQKYEVNLTELEAKRKLEWDERDKAADATREQFSRRIERMGSEIASLKERMSIVTSLNRQLWRGVRILLTQLNGLEITPAWVPDPAWAEMMEEMDAQMTPLPPTIGKKWSL